MISIADFHGLANPHVRLGDEVSEGDHVATIYDIHNFGRIAQELTAPHDGIVSVIRRNPLVDPGDKVLQIAPPLSRDAIEQHCGAPE